MDIDKMDDETQDMLDDIIGRTTNGGCLELLKKYHRMVENYFYYEYFNEDYELDDLDEDLSEIGTAILNLEMFKPLCDTLNEDDLTCFTGFIACIIEDRMTNV